MSYNPHSIAANGPGNFYNSAIQSQPRREILITFDTQIMNSIQNPTIPADPFQNCFWQGEFGCASSLAICNAAADADGPILLLCENNEIVEQSIRELKYFCASKEELPVFSLPDWETLPYDSFSPHQDIISERLNALYLSLIHI